MHRTHGIVVTIARWSARHPWRAIALWLALVVGAVAAGSIAGTVELKGSQEGNGESARAERAVEAAGLGEPIRESALIRRRDGAALTPDDAAVAAALARTVDTLPFVGAVSPPQTAADGTAAAVSWEIARPTPTAIADMERAVRDAAAGQPDVRVDQVGDLTVERALEDAIGDDLGRAERLSLPITLAILLVAFGALIAAVVPLLLAMSCVALAVGLTMVASHLTPVSDAANSVILLIGLAVGVDYSIFFMRRARDERHRGAGSLDAVEIAAATAGRAVVVSGLTVLVAMSGMFLSGNSIFSSFAIGAMIVVAAAVVASITVLPAAAGKLGRWIDRPRIPLVHRISRPEQGSRMWAAILRPVLGKPKIALLVGTGVLVALAIPALDLNTKLLGTEDMPRSLTVMQTYDALTAAFPSEGNAHSVVVSAADVTAPPVTAAIAELQRQAGASDNFAMTRSDVVVSGDRSVAVVTIPYPGADDGGPANAGLAELRERLVPSTVGAVATAAVSGDPAINRDFSQQLDGRLPLVIGFVLALTFVLMLLAFRSPWVAGLTVLLNTLSVATAYGVLVLVFQNEWAEGLLDFTSNGGIVAWLPLFLFVILFGLSMDYHVFVLSRVREGIARGMGSRDAIRWGVTTSAGVVTSAAVVMVAVFAVFATLSAPDLKQLGVGLAAAIAVDATIVRGVLLPASLAMLGDRAWRMPAWLRWIPRTAGEARLTDAPAES